MIDQLEVANIIVLNKIDLVTKKNLNIVIANLKAINPDSEIIPTNFSKVDLKSVFSVRDSRMALAIPKSITFSTICSPTRATRTLEGLISRWMIPFWWAC